MKIVKFELTVAIPENSKFGNADDIEKNIFSDLNSYAEKSIADGAAYELNKIRIDMKKDELNELKELNELNADNEKEHRCKAVPVKRTGEKETYPGINGNRVMVFHDDVDMNPTNNNVKTSDNQKNESPKIYLNSILRKRK